MHDLAGMLVAEGSFGLHDACPMSPDPRREARRQRRLHGRAPDHPAHTPFSMLGPTLIRLALATAGAARPPQVSRLSRERLALIREARRSPPLGTALGARLAASVGVAPPPPGAATAMIRTVPLAHIARVEAGLSQGSIRKRERDLSSQVHAFGAQTTPYGHVIESMDLDAHHERYSWCYINPHAFLYVMCTTCEAFFGFILQHCPHGMDIALYADEAKPGNVLRPDAGRSALCIYWTITQLPAWFRSRSVGSFLFGILQSKRIEGIAGGSSSVLRKVMNVFWGREGNWNLHTVGVRVPRSHGPPCLLRGRFACFLADEREIKYFWQVKGASGTILCCFCRNIMSGDATFGPNEYLQHFAEATPAQFDLHTRETYEDAKRLLRHEAIHGSNASVNRLSQALGIKHQAEGVLWDDHLAKFANPAQSTYWDWMHILVASGGVLQYECNEFIRALLTVGVELKDLDNFAAAMHWPEHMQVLPTNFFTKRFVAKPASHIHAYASETLSALEVLVVFAALVLCPSSRLQEHLACLLLAVEIVDVLVSERAHLRSELLRRLISAHWVKYRALYPAQLAKPKLHYLWHIPDCIERHQVCLNCFAGERKHKMFKTLAKHTFGHFEEHLTNRSVPPTPPP